MQHNSFVFCPFYPFGLCFLQLLGFVFKVCQPIDGHFPQSCKLSCFCRKALLFTFFNSRSSAGSSSQSSSSEIWDSTVTEGLKWCLKVKRESMVCFFFTCLTHSYLVALVRLVVEFSCTLSKSGCKMSLNGHSLEPWITWLHMCKWGDWYWQMATAGSCNERKMCMSVHMSRREVSD